MRITKTDIPAKIDVPGALARQAVDFGDASECGSLSAEESCVEDDLFYWRPGHSVRVVRDADVILFSPQVEHGKVMDHMLAQIAG